ncbi:hypothetical protein BKA62DRAFT_758890, partial [Auriculariales sp. MPI-PUGE-AT-0066]
MMRRRLSEILFATICVSAFAAFRSTSSSSVAAKMSLAKLADETLSEILVHLPHEDLLMAQRVCKKWCKVVSSDPHILEQLFKKRVGKYIPPMSLSRTMESVIALKRKDPVLRMIQTFPEMHPAISRISY